ncbi:trypsin-like serine protease [Rhizohabitans arisaemae]|uniref:trypsin-like serine protease n=1 Tax=Rhizohabitans arisaemae TaxID=2720610 RepID=UPI0024B1B40E|nr:trypsin-like serine protease [Rhizohabitans arisaemae]
MFNSPVSAATTATITPVEVITEDPFANPVPLSHTTRYALEKVEERALANPDVYAAPYVTGGQLYSPVVNAAEQPTAETLSVPPPPPVPDNGTDDLAAVPAPDEGDKPADPPPAAATAPEPEAPGSQAAPQAAPPRVNLWIEAPLVQHSLTRLEEIKDEVLELTPAVLPGADKLFSATIQPELNRVLVEATEAPEALRTALAVRYGTGAVAVLLVPGGGPIEPQARQNDGSPFYGGARMQSIGLNCTGGFAWRVDGAPHVLTAGHCTGMGSWVHTPVTRMGKVVKDNWGNTTGTVKIDGQRKYYGDLSLVKVDSGKTSSARIYVGNATSGASRVVTAPWSRRSKAGDKYCVGGATQGELCGWVVGLTGINIKYSSGTVARNLVRGKKQGKCTDYGDSGGPVYTVNSAGKVVAKGIHSGKGGGGTDNYGGPFDPCFEYYTDIWDAYDAMPGVLALG